MLEVVDKSDDTKYYPYHRNLSNTVDDYITFENSLEHYYQFGAMVFPEDYLIEQLIGLIKIVFRETYIFASC